jgi:hypothetical protein
MDENGQAYGFTLLKRSNSEVRSILDCSEPGREVCGDPVIVRY